MNYPYMLIMRNSPSGMVWQAYEVRDDKETELLTRSATHNGFLVQKEPAGYTDETTPGWRDTQDWQDYRAGRLSERAKGQMASREILKPIRRDGPYWLDGYNDWLVSCFSLRSPDDFHGFTPIACWSELIKDAGHPNGYCAQWMVCIKDGAYYVDYLGFNFSQHGVNGYGLDPAMKLATDQTYSPHIYDWIFKDIIPTHQRGGLPALAKPVSGTPETIGPAGVHDQVGNAASGSGSAGGERARARRPRQPRTGRPVAEKTGLRRKVAVQG